MNLKAAVRALADRLPEPRREAFLTALRSTRTLLRGDAPAPRPDAEEQPTRLPRAASVDETTWPSPDLSTDLSGRITDDRTQQPPERFTVELLESLNQEYSENPLVKSPPTYDAPSLEAAAKKRVKWVHSMVDLRDKRVLEIGCGSGLESWFTAHGLDSEVNGVDIVEWTTWASLQSDRVKFTVADLATDHPFPPESFHRVMSFTVWEHVRKPYELLEETFRLLKPGGLAWIRANLYLGPKASHRYRNIHFPWPHLLFDDAVIAEWDRRHGRETTGAAWVNRLSWCHYRSAFERIGFRLIHLSFDETPIDEAFYSRFENILSRYPRWDLSKDFFLVVLQKPG